ncbi:uncharacterized protein LOC126801113 isoform X2 [Argentina anserina]|uniref:uncharacterized protein LOC126783790 isoform X2 n=1 Tax=Argentina anserina TaxID=57926 RepID=UPI0021765ABF|nr:uncharacterized protein LOC126783790 isoform X2 [Potentilla anserina]XP_050365282.1 uncharacterized protein LOC126783790 isoform X2 [Potentilla anserina]XP_050368271.1 uncharacterized protein LOC126786479 isoform X2 [Potentilla anserina]XP_050368272.1 uncharacterized protein LOC126786479 isoform X2 [Potentilla anserina]XP_050384530.1 uncharacterized protein LOC126801113 isoform X2 [Potentilla anserina]XP_050384531.1 uncharacterized protein LOC126801113 isoform X2 [Potentilla anserina]
MPLRNRSKWFESIFAILRIGKSLELTMASFKLLNELDKCFPWVHLSAAADEMKSSSELSLIVENEVGHHLLSAWIALVARGWLLIILGDTLTPLVSNI